MRPARMTGLMMVLTLMTARGLADEGPRVQTPELGPLPKAELPRPEVAPLPVQLPTNGPCGEGPFNGILTPEPVAHHGHWIGGAGFYFLQPNFESNTAFVIHKRLGPDSVANVQQDFRHHTEVAPLAWIGYVGESGLGVRGRWWQFDQDAHESITKDDSILKVLHARPLGVDVDFGTRNGSVFNFASNLRLQVWDLEATKVFSGCNWCVLWAGGVRYVHMSQDYHASGPRSETFLDVESGHNFNGVGPTVAFEGRRNLCCGFALYCTARGSVLFGTGRQVAQETVTDLGTGAVTHATLNTAQQADVLPIGELEVGVEYGCNLGKVHAFVEAGFVGQVWWGAGNASNTDVTGVNPDNNSNLGFVGGVCRVGFSF